MDAFRADYLLIGFGSSLLFGQILPHILIPAFYYHARAHSEEDAWRFCFSLGAVLGLLTLGASLIICIDPEPLVTFLAPGLRDAARAQACALAKYFSLSLALMTWSGVMNGILHIYRIFIVLPLCQILSNVLLVTAVMLFGGISGLASIGGAVLASSALMVLIHVLCLLAMRRRLGFEGKILKKFSSVNELRLNLRAAWPLFLLFGVQQFTIVIMNRAWSVLSPGTLAKAGYAWKLLMLSSLVPTSLAIVMFPSLSEAAARGNSDLERHRLERALRMSLFLCIPLLPVLYILRSEIVQWLFARGAMGAAQAGAIGDVFGLLLIGAPAGVISAVLMKFFCARQDVRTPLLAGVMTAIASAILAPWAARTEGVWGVAMVLNLTSWMNAVALFFAQMWLHRMIRVGKFALYVGKLSAISASIAALALVNPPRDPASPITRALLDLTVLAGSLGIWYWVARALSVAEAHEILTYAKSRICGVPARLGLRA
jgi:putative peptidoglycan lipid II flippase